MNRPWSARLITAVLMAAFASAVVGDMPALSSGRQFGSLHIQLQAGIDERYPRLHLAALNGDGGVAGATEARELKDFALLFQHQSRYADAEPLYQRRLALHSQIV